MSALGDIASALGPAAQGIGQGLLGGAERQQALQQQAFSQGQARTKLDLDKQELQLRGKALDSQETQQARQILANMQSEVWKHRTDPALESYWQGAGKDVAAKMDDWLNRSYHALASNKASDLFSVMQEHPEAAMYHATAAGVPLPAGAQAQPATPASGGAGTPTNGSAPSVAAPPAAGGAGGASPPVSPEVKALVQSLFGPVMGGPQSAQISPGVVGPQPPVGAFRDATGTVMPPAASTPAPTVGAGPAAMAQAGGANGAAPVAAAPAPGASPQSLEDFAIGQIKPYFTPLPGELPGVTDEKRAKGLELAIGLENAGISRARLAQEFGLKQQELQQSAQLEREKMASTEKISGNEIGSREKIAGNEITSRQTIAAGEQATQLIGHALTYDAAAASRNASYDQNYVKNAQDAIRTQIQDERAKAMLLRGQLSALVREDMASQARVTNGVYQSTTGSGGIKVGLADIGGINAALSETGGSREGVTQTRFYNTPEHVRMMDAMTQLHQMEAKTPPYIPRNIGEARLLGEPINGQDQQAMRGLIGADGGNLGALQKKFMVLKTGNPAAAIRMVNTYQTMYPGRPLPNGVALGAISNPEGVAAKAAADQGSMTPAGFTGIPNQNAVGGMGMGEGIGQTPGTRAFDTAGHPEWTGSGRSY